MTAASNAISSSRLDGKVAVVTGSGRGIGRAIGIELGARGASVVINHSKSSGPAAEVAKTIDSEGGKATCIQADVSDPDQIVRLYEETIALYGRLDIVVSNAGMESFNKTAEVTPEIFDLVFGLNARAQFFIAKHAYTYLSQGGRVIMMSSIAAHVIGVKDHALYAGSKAAVEGFVRSFAADFGCKGITVNGIAPGGIKTDMYANVAWNYIPGADSTWPVEKVDQAMMSANPLQRSGSPIDIARVVGFLASQDGEWVNGKNGHWRNKNQSLIRRQVKSSQ